MGQPHTGPRRSIHRNEANTTTYNSNFPTQQSQKVALLATRFVHPPSWLTPPTTPTFPHQQAEKSPQNQHVLSCNPKTPPAPVRRLPESQAAMPVGGGRAWPDNEPTRRAKLAARTSRGRAAAHGHTKQPGPEQQREGRCTRYGPLHPLRADAPDQKGCTAYGSGAAPRITRTNAESARRAPTISQASSMNGPKATTATKAHNVWTRGYDTAPGACIKQRPPRGIHYQW